MVLVLGRNGICWSCGGCGWLPLGIIHKLGGMEGSGQAGVVRRGGGGIKGEVVVIGIG